MRFNHFHDQLILTSSSDSRVILSNIMSLSSEPFGNVIDDENEDVSRYVSLFFSSVVPTKKNLTMFRNH